MHGDNSSQHCDCFLLLSMAGMDYGLRMWSNIEFTVLITTMDKL